MKCSNYVGAVLEMAVEMGFEGILFVAHIGKFIKVSGGIMNTHSHQADCRAELLAAQALRRGGGSGNRPEDSGDGHDRGSGGDSDPCRLSERDYGRGNGTDCVLYAASHRGTHPYGSDCFSSRHGVLGESAGAGELIRQFQKKSKTPQQATGHQTCPGEEEKG